MKLVSKTMMVLSLVVVTSGLLLMRETELSRSDYASAAVPAPGPSQKKVIIKNLRMV